MKNLLLTIIMTLCLTTSLSAITDPNTKISFPDSVSVKENDNSHKLEVTGVATRTRKVFVAKIKVYSIAHYMEKPQKKSNAASAIEEVLSSDKNKQLTITYYRGVGIKIIKGAYDKAFDQVFSKSERSNMQNEINKFLGFFKKDAKEKDQYVFQWLSDGKLIVKIDGKKVGEIDNNDFAKAVWEIWFKTKDIIDSKDLVSKIS